VLETLRTAVANATTAGIIAFRFILSLL